jgi:hypothetical protein
MAKSKVTEETRKRAFQMRSEGTSYVDIVAELASQGITENWCKRNLSTVKVFDTHFFLMEELIPLATRPEGIARLEFRAKVKQSYGIPFDQAIPASIERKTRRALPDDAFIRPDWMEPQAARASQMLIVQGASDLHDRLEEMVAEYCYHHPAASAWHVRQEILQLATGAHPAGPMVQGARMLDAVDTMEERVPQKLPVEPTFIYDDEFDRQCI